MGASGLRGPPGRGCAWSSPSFKLAPEANAALSQRRRLLLTLFPAVLLAILFSTFLGSHVFSGRHTFHGKGLKPISLEHIANGTFRVDRQNLNWMAEG